MQHINNVIGRYLFLVIKINNMINKVKIRFMYFISSYNIIRKKYYFNILAVTYLNRRHREMSSSIIHYVRKQEPHRSIFFVYDGESTRRSRSYKDQARIKIIRHVGKDTSVVLSKCELSPSINEQYYN